MAQTKWGVKVTEGYPGQPKEVQVVEDPSGPYKSREDAVDAAEEYVDSLIEDYEEEIQSTQKIIDRLYRVRFRGF